MEQINKLMRQEKKLKIALWGTGDIARIYVDAIRENADLCEIVALINHNRDRAERLKEVKNLSVPVYTSFTEMLQSAEPDAVCVLLPPYLHKDAVIEAAEHGCSVLVEKPMANSLEECDAMIEAAERNKVMLMTVCQKRFTTEAFRVKKLLTSGKFGAPRFAAMQSFWLRGEHYHDLSWRGSWKYEGGGVLTSQALHDLDQVENILGVPERVEARIANLGHGNTECEDWADITMYYEHGIAQFTASLVSPGERHELVIYTDRNCCLSMPWNPAAAKITPNGFSQESPELLKELREAYEAIPALRYDNHAGQIRSFLQAVRGEAKPALTPQNGRDIIELLTAVYESAVTGKAVELPIAKDDPFYTLEGKVRNMPHFHEKYRSINRMQEGTITLA